MKSLRHQVVTLAKTSGTLIAVVGLTFALGCTHKPTKDANGADSANGAAGQDSAPAITD